MSEDEIRPLPTPEVLAEQLEKLKTAIEEQNLKDTGDKNRSLRSLLG